MSERACTSRVLRGLSPALAALLVAAAGLLAGGYLQYLIGLALVSALVGASLVMIVGYGRVIMLASGAMMGIGAYASALLIQHLDLSYLATLVAAPLVGLAAGTVLAVPATRFRGHHLAMVTMVFQFLVSIALREGGEWTGGSLGLRFPPVDVFGMPVSDFGWLLIIAAASAVALGIITILLRGRFGKSLRAIAASEVAAEGFGMDVRRYRVAAFMLSSACLVYAGALLGPRLRILDPDSFGISQSVMALAYPVVGGMDSIWGGMLGGALLKLLPDALRGFGKYQELIVAALVIALMVFQPRGLIAWFGLAFEQAPFAQRRAGRKQAAALARIEPAQTRGTPGASPAPLGPWPAPVDVAAIELAGAQKCFGALRAVDSVSLSVAQGEIHGLIGPNGAGKTTLFNAVSGFLALDRGQVLLFGERLEGRPSSDRIRLGVTRTFQHVAVFGSLSCEDNVLLGLPCNGVMGALAESFGEFAGSGSHASAIERCREALAEVGLASSTHLRAATLSLGDQRRLEIARAIVSRPRLILLDEPVSGVTEEEETAIAQLLSRLNRDHGIAMLVVEHNIGFVRNLCHRVSVMSAGNLIAQGEPDAVLDLPLVRRSYFGERDERAA